MPDQYRALGETSRHIAGIVRDGWHVAIGHGNGSQVGFIMRRSELARHELHEVPLDVCDADTQCAIGYELQQNLGNDFRRLNRSTSASSSSLPTQLVSCIGRLLGIESGDASGGARSSTPPGAARYTSFAPNHLTSPKGQMPKQVTGIERALDGYRQLVKMLSAARTPEFPEPGVTMAQMRVLMLLSVTGETRMSHLPPQLGISLSTLSSLIDRLVEADLARRREDPADRRNVLVSLTPAGVSLLDAFQELGIEHLRTLLDQLTDGDVETVNQAIDVLVAAARRMTAEDSR